MVKGRTDAEGKFLARPYTPISTNGTSNQPFILFAAYAWVYFPLDDKGICEILVKMYPTGGVSEYVYSLKVLYALLYPLFFNWSKYYFVN